MKKKNASLLLLLLLCAGSLTAGTILSAYSPNKQIRIDLLLRGSDLYYTVLFNNKAVIEVSPLVMEIDRIGPTANVHAGDPIGYAIHESYPLWGAHAVAHNDCNGIKLPLQNIKGMDTLDIRVFNSGVAFRFISPGSPDQQRMPLEATAFMLPTKSILWYHDLVGHYEGAHVRKQIDSIKRYEWVAPPATFQLPGDAGYASITEADLKDYAGMALIANGLNGLTVGLAHEQKASHPYELRYSKEDILRLSKPAVIAGTITTPWRVIIIGKDLNTLVNSDIVTNLCPAPDKRYFPDGLHTSWLRPGRAVWKYLDGGGDGTPETMRRFTDQAAQLGFEHNILEGFWNRWPDSALKNFTDYSKQKQVDIWVWEHSKTLRDSAARQQFWQRCVAGGVRGAKIDFFDHEAKEVIDLYQAILRESAQYHIMVDFHGANKPTGQQRTWPNEMTREAVKGMESSKFEDRATHETTIPFTRLLAGPAEYTVVMFGDRRRNTSWAHQVASAAILSAPMLTYAASPENIGKNPAVDIIKKIPSCWDETIVLPGSEIGGIAAYARRSGNKWFVAVMNGIPPHKLSISLRFLGPGRYKASIAEDVADNPAALNVHTAAYSSGDVLLLSLAAGGGYIAVFEKQ
jgi:alpha-glucosidase